MPRLVPASGFGTTFLWVLAIPIPRVPTIRLARTERHARRRADASKLEEALDARR